MRNPLTILATSGIITFEGKEIRILDCRIEDGAPRVLLEPLCPELEELMKEQIRIDGTLKSWNEPGAPRQLVILEKKYRWRP